MHRLISLTLLLLVSLSLRAQVDLDRTVLLPDDIDIAGDTVVVQAVADAAKSMVDIADASIVADTAVVTDTVAVPAAAPVRPVPDYMRRSVSRSWRRSHPVRPLSRGLHNAKGSHSTKALLDSLRRSVSLDADISSDMRYLYDMRLPVISSGSVPLDSMISFSLAVSQDEERADRSDLPITHFDDLYVRQLQNEDQRHLARFNYASSDPRRFRYARRQFDVPTNDSRTIDTKATVQGTRVVDDIDINFGNADLESFGQYFYVKADRWHWKGDHTLTMQQTALSSNWYNGGDNNMSVSGEQKLTVSRYDEDSKVTFEAVFDLKLSGYYTKADTIHRMRVSDNEFTLNMKYGYKAWKKWYYSAQLYAKTPVFDFYNANSRVCKTTFLSPLEMNVALGVDYQYTSPKKKFTYSLLLAPLSYDMKYVSDPRVNVTAYKIKEGESSIHNFGSTVTTKFDWKMGPNATWSSRLYYFTTYHSMKVEFENTFNFKISRFFTARAYFYPRFDDNSDTKAEVKEMLTVGFSYAW